MSQEDLHHLKTVAKAARKIERYIDNTTFQEFAADSMCRDAVLHNLQVISASVTRLPESVRQEHAPGEGWAFIQGMLEHEEPTVDWARVWQTVRRQLPPLNRSVKAALAQNSAGLLVV